MDFENINKLTEYGFTAPISLSDLIENECQQTPAVAGVYVVIRELITAPDFLDVNIGGHFKEKNPTVSKASLQDKWVDNVVILYVGETDNLQRRLTQLIQFGQGKPVGHWGGRYLWQLEDSADLLVSWRLTSDEDPRGVKRRMLQTFRARYGKLPFANLRN